MYTKARRIKTHPISGTQTIAAATTLGSAVLANWAATDDIYVIGVELLLEVGSVAVGTKADGENIVSAEVTRAGQAFNDNVMIRSAHGVVEEDTAGAHPRHDGLYKIERVMFPTDCGVMIDEGEYINVIGAFSNKASVGRIFKVEVVIYYIER